MTLKTNKVCCCCLFVADVEAEGLFFVVLLGDHEALEMLPIDHAAIDLELAEGGVNLVGGEFFSPGHQRVAEHLCVDLTVDLEGLERSHDDIVIVSSSGHLLCEECHHLGEVDGTRGLSDHVSTITVADRLTDRREGRLEVGSSDDSILVVVNDTESLLELLDLLLAEEGEDVGAALLGLLGSFRRHLVILVILS